MKNGNRRFYFLIILISILWGVYASLKFSYPMLFAGNEISSGFVPVRYHPNSISDDYFYYAKVRDLIDLKFASGDPATDEYQWSFTPHALYGLSLLLGSVAGIVSGGDAELNILFNNFFLPALSFFLLAIFIHTILQHLTLSVLITIIALVRSEQMARFPNIMATNIPLTLTMIMLIRPASLSALAMRKKFVLGFLLGSSLLVSVPNFMITACMASALSLKELFRRRYAGILQLALISIIFLIPGLFVLWSSLSVKVEFFNSAIPPLDQYFGFQIDLFRYELKSKFLVPFLLFLIPVNFPKKLTLFLILISLLVGYCLVSVLDGSYLARYFTTRGADLFFASLPLIIISGNVLNFDQLHPKLRLIQAINFILSLLNKYKKIINICFVFIFMIFTIRVCTPHFKESWRSVQAFASTAQDSDLKQLYVWLETNSVVHENALSVDPDLHLTLNTYTPLNFHLPWAQGGPAPQKERLFKFFDLMTIYGVNEDGISKVFSSMIPSYQMKNLNSEKLIRFALLQLVLFYGPYAHEPMTARDLEIYRKMYSDYKNQKRDLDKLKFSFLILSKYDIISLNPDTSLSRQISDLQPAFENSTYTVYRLYKH